VQYLIAKLEAESQLIGTLNLPILAKLVPDGIAQKRAVVIWKGRRRAS